LCKDAFGIGPFGQNTSAVRHLNGPAGPAAGTGTAKGNHATGASPGAAASSNTLGKNPVRTVTIGNDATAVVDCYAATVSGPATGPTKGSDPTGPAAGPAAAADALGENRFRIISPGRDTGPVDTGHIPAIAATRTGAAEGNNAAAASGVTTATADALYENTPGIITRHQVSIRIKNPGTNHAVVRDANRVASTATAAAATNGHRTSTSTSGSAAAADTLGNDGVGFVALCGQ
jgi:hypothetical protein